MSDKPLSGVKVLELGLHVTAPSAAAILRQFGADVIKIERPDGGDPWRGTSTWATHTSIENSPVYDLYNMGKRDIVIDYKSPEGMELMDKLLSKADIFVTNIRLKSLKNSALDPDTICKKYPQLIYGRITGYGDLGPMAGLAAFDNIAFWARTGFARDIICADNSDEPILSGVGIGDALAGNTLCTAILAALFRREKTGKGEAVEVSLFGTGIWASGCMILQAQKQYGKKFPRKTENCTMFDVCYRCCDGDYIKIANKKAGVDSFKILKILDLIDDVNNCGLKTYNEIISGGGIVIPLMRKAIAQKDAEEWISIMQAQDIAVEKALHFSDICTDEQAIANGYVYPYKLRGGGSCMMPDYPARMSSVPVNELCPVAPYIGEQTMEVLRDYGYSEEYITEYIYKYLNI